MDNNDNHLLEMENIYKKNKSLFEKYHIPEFILNQEDSKRVWHFYHREKDNLSTINSEIIIPFHQYYWPYLIRQIITFEAMQTLDIILKKYAYITTFKISQEFEYEGWTVKVNFFEKNDYCVTEHISTQLLSQLKNKLSGRLWSHAVHCAHLNLSTNQLWKTETGKKSLLLAAYGERGFRYLQEALLKGYLANTCIKQNKTEKI